MSSDFEYLKAAHNAAQIGVQYSRKIHGDAYAPGTGKWLPYHGATHPEFMLSHIDTEGRELVAKGLITLRQLANGKKAIAWHDSVQNLGSGDNELASAELAIKAMQEAHTSLDEITVKDQIKTTIVTASKENGLLKLTQNASPNTPGTAFVADFDLAGLSQPYGSFMAVNLLLEQYMLTTNEQPKNLQEALEMEIPRDFTLGFFANQNGLLTTHQYVIPALEAKWGPGREKNREANNYMAECYRRGAALTDLHQLATITMDVAQQRNTDMQLGLQ